MLDKMIKKLELDFEHYQGLQLQLESNDKMFAVYSGKLDSIIEYYELLVGEKNE